MRALGRHAMRMLRLLIACLVLSFSLGCFGGGEAPTNAAAHVVLVARRARADGSAEARPRTLLERRRALRSVPPVASREPKRPVPLASDEHATSDLYLMHCSLLC